MNVEIRKLSINDGYDIYEMLQEIPANENGFINSMNNKNHRQYSDWLAGCENNSNQKEIIDGWKVPESTFWLYIDDEPVGYGKVRHCLTDALLKDGGNVGYAIRPAKRNKGYGNIIVSKLLKECHKLGVPKALLTIKQENKPSIAVALANGGAIEKEVNGLVYIWIDCEK